MKLQISEPVNIAFEMSIEGLQNGFRLVHEVFRQERFERR
jgi:hypothetical protein